MHPHTLVLGLSFMTTTAVAVGKGTAHEGAGLVGLGRQIFQPLCCYACLSSIWALQLPCTPERYVELGIGNPPQCHATNSVYLSTLAYCLQQKCATDTSSSPEKVDKCWNNVAGDGEKVPTLEASLPKMALTVMLPYNATSLGHPWVI